MLEVTINGKSQKVPQCTCGKCIVRRLRKDWFTSLPYSKNLGTTYTIDYPWKTRIKDPGYYNRSMHNGFENSFKEHLPNGMLSEMKAQYTPKKTDESIYNKVPTEIYSTPFIGRSTYEVKYPNWGAISAGHKGENVKLPDINVPFRGNSNYTENYVKFPEQYYASREPLNFAKATLKFYGNIKPDTTYRTSYKPVDFNQPHYFPKEKDENPNLKSIAFLNPETGNLDTTYREHYIKYEDGICKLRKYLNSIGMRYLVI
jgi:hypothetical protein